MLFDIYLLINDKYNRKSVIPHLSNTQINNKNIEK